MSALHLFSRAPWVKRYALMPLPDPLAESGSSWQHHVKLMKRQTGPGASIKGSDRKGNRWL
eukprot:530945-Pelagomonas_calceolata.AAC.2